MRTQNGYTILEVMIFIAISGFMLVAAVAAVGGRQQDVQFQQSVRDFENKINDYISDIEIGYFERDAGFECTASSLVNPEPDISFTTGETGNQQGQSGECVLIGKTIVMGEELAVNSQDIVDKGILRIFDMAGLRLVDQTTNEPAQNIEEARPRPLENNLASVNTYNLQYGLEVEKVIQYDVNLPPQEESATVLSIMNNAQAGVETGEFSDASLSAGSTSAKVTTSTFDTGTSASAGMNDYENQLRVAFDGQSPEFSSIAICVSGPNARGVTGTISNWSHKETAVLVIERNGSTQLIFDGSEGYCDA